MHFEKISGSFKPWVNRSQGRQGWQGPQGLGLAWILHDRKRRHPRQAADLATNVVALPAKKWPWRPWFNNRAESFLEKSNKSEIAVLQKNNIFSVFYTGSFNPNWHETGQIYLLIIFDLDFVS